MFCRRSREPSVELGADGGTRTHGRLITNQVLCQLSYIGISAVRSAKVGIKILPTKYLAINFPKFLPSKNLCPICHRRSGRSEIGCEDNTKRGTNKFFVQKFVVSAAKSPLQADRKGMPARPAATCRVFAPAAHRYRTYIKKRRLRPNNRRNASGPKHLKQRKYKKIKNRQTK